MMRKDNDKLDYMLGLAFTDDDRVNPQSIDDIDDSGVELSASYYRKKKRILNRYKREKTLGQIRSAMPKVAIILLAIITATTISIVSISSLREEVFKAIIDWYETHFAIHFDPPQKEEETTEIETEPIIPPESIEEFRKPTYLPDGVEEEVVYQSQTGVLIDYYLGNEYLFSFSQMPYADRDKYIDTNDVIMEDVNIGKNEAIVVKNTDNLIKLIWNDNYYLYYLELFGVDVEEAVLIAESVK